MVMSHLGRPEEGVYADDFGLRPRSASLNYLALKCVSRKLADGVKCEPGEVVLLKTYASIKARRKIKRISQKMAALCDVFVMDVRHRASRRSEYPWVARFAPVACAGPLLTPN